MTASDPHILDGLYDDVQKAFREDRTILSFAEYFALVQQEPRRYVRSSAQYLVDMFDHYGFDERELPTGRVKRAKLFDAAWSQGEFRVSGQENILRSIYRLLHNFAREGRVNKLILLHGPNGSAKSSIVRCMMQGMEQFARKPDGALYTFNWIFPSEKISSESIGFSSSRADASSKGSYAYLPAESINARVPSGMNDHPLFLLPQAQRQQLFAALLGGKEHEDFTVSDYMRYGDLSHKSRCIYDALLASYDGDVRKVLNHVQVERFYPSRRYRRGLATVEPQMSVDARIQQVTADRSLASLPMALQHVALFDPAGPLVDANRGILEFSDLLKRPVEAYKYLLGTIETASVSLDSFVLHLDMVYIASTNETYLDAFKQHADFPSFKARMELVKVPYLLRYSDELEIYTTQITERVVGKHVAPHALDVAALWAILTRMRRCDASRYPKEISDVINSLTPLEKARLYDTGEVPERLTTREGAELRHVIPDLYQESLSYPNYEGRFGASAREIRTVLLNAAHHPDYTYLSPLAVLEEIEELLGAKSVYDFLNQEVVKGFHDHRAFLAQTTELFTDWIDEEVRESMGLVAEGSYRELFSRYVNHITHWVKREKLIDPTSGEPRDPDPRLMGEIERVLVQEGEKPEDFRRAVIATIGARALENPQEKPDSAKIFSKYIELLREDFYQNRRDELRRINENFLRYTSHDEEALAPEDLNQVREMLQTLEKRYGYTLESARDTVAYLLKKRYAS